MDFGFFDSLYDAVFVLNKEKEILYCNEAAATLCNSSVRRLSKGKRVPEVIQLSDPSLLGAEASLSEQAIPWQELEFQIVGQEKEGKVQISLQPFHLPSGEASWVIVLHDVTLEETLHRKYQGELKQKEGVIEELMVARGQLEEYSKNLEKMVEQRTLELRAANRMLTAIMDSLGQGFLTFDKEGTCSNFFTKACLELLECEPSHKRVWEVLGVPENEIDQFKMWMTATYSESLPFDSMKDLAPKDYSHKGGKRVTLDYFPIRDDDESISNLVVVATDKTAEYRAREALEQEKKYAQMILKVIKSQNQFVQFLKSAEELIVEVQKLTGSSSAEHFDRNEAFRLLHTLEGEAGAFSAESLRLAARLPQEILTEWEERKGSPEDFFESFKMKMEGLKESLKQFLEDNSDILSVLETTAGRGSSFSAEEIQTFFGMLQSAGVSNSLLEKYRSLFFRVPLDSLMRHFENLSQTVASRQSKSLVPMRFDCAEVRVDPEFVKPLISTLVHAFRNAVDHGIESPEERETLGKNPAGEIRVEACYLGNENEVQLSIVDDGKGIDSEVIRSKAKQKIPGLNVDEMNEDQVRQLVFHPGFSSRDGVGEFSGRGVGMDAIKHEVVKMGGKVWVESTLGKGSRLILQFPVSSANSLTMFSQSA